MLLGGQHIARVMFNMYHYYLDAERVAEESIPRPYRYVRAMILREGTSGDVCALAAGLHQTTQRGAQDTMFSEICSAIVRKVRSLRKQHAEETARKLGKDRRKTQEMIESAKDAPLVMSNEELWVTLKELGASTREEETVEATVCNFFHSTPPLFS